MHYFGKNVFVLTTLNNDEDKRYFSEMTQMTKSQITQQINAIQNGKQIPWGQLSILLDSVEKTKYWKPDSESFTNWIETNAHIFGAKPTTLWRVLSSGRYVECLRNSNKLDQCQIPSPSELTKAISPENVEILAKLERVLPEEKFKKVAHDVLSKKATRADLRAMWQNHKAILAGRTARGAGTPIPKFDNTNSSQLKKSEYAQFLDFLDRGKLPWLEQNNIEIYRNFKICSLDCNDPQRLRIKLVSIGYVKTQNLEAEYHGFCFPLPSPEDYIFQLAYCDYLWILLDADSGKFLNSSHPTIPQNVGLLSLSADGLSVELLAQKSTTAPEQKNYITAAMLLNSLKNSK